MPVHWSLDSFVDSFDSWIDWSSSRSSQQRHWKGRPGSFPLSSRYWRDLQCRRANQASCKSADRSIVCPGWSWFRDRWTCTSWRVLLMWGIFTKRWASNSCLSRICWKSRPLHRRSGGTTFCPVVGSCSFNKISSLPVSHPLGYSRSPSDDIYSTHWIHFAWIALGWNRQACWATLGTWSAHPGSLHSDRGFDRPCHRYVLAYDCMGAQEYRAGNDYGPTRCLIK